MSESRQHDGILMRTFGVTFPGGSVIPPHSGDWDQLIYASRGVMSIHTAERLWVVPAHRAVWAPAGSEYRVEMVGTVSMRTLYLLAGLAGSMPKVCCTVNISPLLRELILHTVKLSTLSREVPNQARLIGVILDQLTMLPEIPLQLPWPTDPRALAVAKLMQESPGDERPLAAIAKQCGASARTIERIFARETSMTFNRWRQRLKVLHALRLLALGENVTSVALAAGYNSPSAFCAMFRSELGTTPSRYYRSPTRA